MSMEPIVVGMNASLGEAVRLMDEHRVSGLPVVDRSGSLVGVVSQTDLARARSTEHLWANWPGLAVRHLMTHPAVTVRRSVPLAVAIRRMERMRVHRLVVVDDRDPELPIGVLSLTDVVHSIAMERQAALGADGG
ncbi:MAG TPA: CBS domain-containing protein [Candidatus Limnocylindrales bacterium]|nr:CBS domain-containing protein [Candidatus Limnocylindrales bacterium]